MQSGVVPEHGEAMSTERSSDTDSDIDYLHVGLTASTHEGTVYTRKKCQGRRTSGLSFWAVTMSTSTSIAWYKLCDNRTSCLCLMISCSVQASLLVSDRGNLTSAFHGGFSLLSSFL